MSEASDVYGTALSVERLMRDIEEEARRARRARILAHGGATEYRDPEVFRRVEGALRRALETRGHDLLLLPELLGDETEWRLETRLRFSSHRPLVGPLLVFIKRRVLLPMTRWLYEYSLENFRRQQRVNELLFSCIEELAIENVRLARLLDRDLSTAEGQGDPFPK
jgi:hypothetical protein